VTVLGATRPTAGRAQEVRVVVADDDDLMRRAVVDVLGAHGAFAVVGEVADGAELADLVVQTEAALVVLDVRMPSGGAAVTRLLRSRPPSPVVVAVSASTDLTTVTAMLRAGAAGFLAKGRLGTTFGDDLLRCLEGQVILAVPHATQVLEALRTAPDPDALEQPR
jgi:two-component system nitrate/nitrite response regulator NarL